MNSQTEFDALATIVATPTLSSKSKKSTSLLQYRLIVLYRFILAIFGGYVLASLTAIVTAKTFADHRTSAVMAATLLAFSIHCAAFIWVFMVNKTLKASLGIILPCLILFIIHLALGN